MGKKKSPKTKQLLNKFVSRGGGSKVTTGEAKKIVKRTGATTGKDILKAAKKTDAKLDPKAKKFLRNFGKVKDTDKPGEDIVKDGGTTGIFQDEGTGIFGPISQHEKDIANIYADADKYIADAEVRGIDISSGRQLEGVKYGADKESEWRQAVANIEVKGRLDLQPIINAGLEKVAGIEAQAQRDVAETTGKYNVEGIRVRGEADKQIGGMQLAGNMYNLINAAFG
jgi:hypothetical protein